MHTINKRQQADALHALAGQLDLDIPRTAYEKAEKRYRSLGEWLRRPESSIAHLDPDVYPQGSFRYGTVIRCNEGYDLDLVCELRVLAKDGLSQSDLKEMVGKEVAAYAKAHGMNATPDRTRRCWHLDYADDVHFHIDILPAIPEDDEVKDAIAAAIRLGLGLGDLARFAIAITDEKHPSFDAISSAWPTSNPRGFARWFEERMRPAAERILKAAARTIEDVPTYDWKTPLQVAIQILKQHRDGMFDDDRDRMPISMIITTLAALAYDGQDNLQDTLNAFVERVPGLVDRASPRILNPVNPGENFADKWQEKPELADAFWEWFEELRRDLDRLGQDLSTDDLQRHIEKRFSVAMRRDRLAGVVGVATAPAVATSRAERRTEPWGTIG